MKTGLKFLMLSICVLFTFGSTDNIPETHIITLNVDTGQINSTNVEETSNFGQGQGTTNSNFATTVKNGDIVLWRGVSSSSPENDEVLVEIINHEGGARVFGRNTLKDTRQNPGIVVGTVTEGKDGDEEKYTLSFKVLNNGEQRGGTYHIDPKIIVKM